MVNIVHSILLALLVAIISVRVGSATGCTCWVLHPNESLYSGICSLPAVALRPGNQSVNDIPLVLNGSECSSFDYLPESARLAVGVIVAIFGSLAYVAAFALTKLYNTSFNNAVSFVVFQWIMSVSMWSVGMVVNFAVAGQPTLYYFTTTGGILLSASLLLMLPVVSQFGLAISGAIISTSLLLGGWIVNQLGLCIQCTMSVERIISVVLLCLGLVMLVVVAVTKDNKGTSVLSHQHRQRPTTLRLTDASPIARTGDNDSLFHSPQTETEMSPLHQRGTRSLPLFGSIPNVILPKRMSSLTPAKEINQHEQEARASGDDETGSDQQQLVTQVKLGAANETEERQQGRCIGKNRHDDRTGGKGTETHNQTRSIQQLRSHQNAKWVWIKKVVLVLACVAVGICWGSQFVSIKLQRSCNDSDLFPCNLLVYMLGHMSGSLLFSSLLLIIFLISTMVIKQYQGCRHLNECIRICEGSSVGLKMILTAIGTGVLWGVGLVGQLLAESMISFALVLPITTAVFTIATSLLGLLVKEFTWRLFLMFGMSLLVSIIAIVVFPFGYRYS